MLNSIMTLPLSGTVRLALALSHHSVVCKILNLVSKKQTRRNMCDLLWQVRHCWKRRNSCSIPCLEMLGNAWTWMPKKSWYANLPWHHDCTDLDGLDGSWLPDHGYHGYKTSRLPSPGLQGFDGIHLVAPDGSIACNLQRWPVFGPGQPQKAAEISMNSESSHEMSWT